MRVIRKRFKPSMANFNSPFSNKIPEPDIPHVPPFSETKIPYGKLALIAGGAAGVNLGIAFYARNRRTKNGKMVVERVRKKR